jgi:rod shape-determining protein MreD
VGLLLFGFALLVVQAAVSTLVPLYSMAPNLMLPIAILLGVSPDVQIVRGTALCFALGYLFDSFCGNPMGLQTFVLVASFMVARGAGLRLFPQGPAFQIFLTFLMALLNGATVMALRAIFEQQPIPGLGDAAGESGVTLLKSAATTALIAPLVFAGARRIGGTGVTAKVEQRAGQTS